MTIPYSFDTWRESLGRDFWADDPELGLVLTHHGLADGLGRERVARYGVYAMLQKDLNAIVGTVLVIGAMFVLVNILVDLVVAYINPRIRLQGEGT